MNKLDKKIVYGICRECSDLVTECNLEDYESCVCDDELKREYNINGAKLTCLEVKCFKCSYICRKSKCTQYIELENTKR